MDYKVKQGECVLSIAFEKGLAAKAIWNDSRNEELRKKRKFMELLMPGDVIVLPDKNEKIDPVPTEKKHVYRNPLARAFLRLKLRLKGEPVANRKTTVTIDGVPFEDTTGPDGELNIPIPPNSKKGILRLDGDRGSYTLKLGYMDPVGEVSGLQGRLYNVGFDPLGIDNKYGKDTRTAMRKFQSKEHITQTQSPNDSTRERLVKSYGC